MGHKPLKATKDARKILKELGFKRGEYRIENCLTYARGSGKEYGRTYIYMRKEVTEQLCDDFVKRGFTLSFPSKHPIFTF